MEIVDAERPAEPGEMPPVRVRIDLAYDGSDFAGWATQPGLRTVQGEIESALATLFAGASGAVPPRVVVAGRTDAGVHATGQVLHVDLDADRLAALARAGRGSTRGRPLAAPDVLVRRLGGLVGQAGDIVIHGARVAPPGFDARFSPVWRRYEYRIADGTQPADPRTRRHTLAVRDILNVDAMNEAADALLGLRDFGAFCKPRDGATTIRTLQEYVWRRDRDGVLTATVRADAFCHSMVRSLVGAAIAVGRGALSVPDLVTARDAAARTSRFPVVAPHGLTLVEVGYPPDGELATRADQTRAKREIVGTPPVA